MSNLIPASWRESAEQLRDNVLDTFDRWLPQRHRKMRDDEGPWWPASLLTMGGPAVEVVEDDEAVRVTAELPGLTEKDFTLEVQGNRLLLRGEKKSTREEKKRDCYFSECSYGSFSRSIGLPCEVDTAKCAAKYKNGVLEVTLPKTEQAKARRIKINVS